MDLPSFITLPYALERDPPPFEGQDIKYPESLVRYFLNALTRKGDKVFDPFAGLGTTLFVAEEMGRVPYGVEYDEDRHAWSAGQLEHWMNLRHGDSARLDRFGLPRMDFCMTSPPFMRVTDKTNPLCPENPARAGYDAYLRRMKMVYGRVAMVMKRHAWIVVHVDNIPGRVFTPLAWDVGHVLSAVLKPAGEVTVQWRGGPADYPATRCLLFKNSL